MKEFMQTMLGVVFCLGPTFTLIYLDWQIEDEHFKILQKLRNRN